MGANRTLTYVLGGMIAIAATTACSLKPKTMNTSQSQVSPFKVNSWSPTAASTLGGATLTINGSGFDAATRVRFGSVECLNTRAVNSTTLRCTLPPHPPGDMSFTVGNASGSQGATFTFSSDLFTQVDFVAGSYTDGGSVDGTGRAARFNSLRGIASDGVYLYITAGGVSNGVNHHIRRVHIQSGQVETWAGDPSETTGGTGDGPIATAQFISPHGIVRVGRFLYVADSTGSTIRKIDIDAGQVTTFAGQPGTYGATDGDGATTALFNEPTALATDGASLFVVDYSNYTIRKVDLATRQVTTIAGTSGSPGMVDGLPGTGRLYEPRAIVFAQGRLYLADTLSIREIEPGTGAINTFAGRYTDDMSLSEFANGIGPSARFIQPWSLTTDGERLYVGEIPYKAGQPHVIRKIRIDTGEVTTAVGNPAVDVPGTNDGAIDVALLTRPYLVHFDPLGGLFFSSSLIAIRRAR
jgi:hypothetical protein